MPSYSHYGFGSKVSFGDWDEGRPLNSGCGPIFGFRDIGIENKLYDKFEPVYLDMDRDKIICIDDIRITPFAGFIPGSKVKRTDIDIDESIIQFYPNWSISYVDLSGDGTYGLQDPVYLHNKSHGDGIASGDIRLTFFNGLPGTIVASSDTDANSIALDLRGLNNKSNEAVFIRFFNANGNYNLKGNPQYDRPDAVYLHIIASKKELESGTLGLVGPNDLRLSL